METNLILQGDCLDVLKTFPDECIDSYVSDVPYGLGKKEPTVEEIIAFLQGAVLKTGDFKGNDWDIPSVAVWEQVYRVLKPGAHVVAFGGTRTYDLISLGLRAAGFTFRDSIAENHPGIQWVYGQGMPKSTNISMNIDKALGHKFDPKNYSPISEEAKAVAHLGSGLKPSWEPILIFRKPFKGSLMKNVQAHGTGAINIAATRVKHASKEDFEAHKAQVEAVRAKGGSRDGSWKNSSDLSGARPVDDGGRWPANLILTHSHLCEMLGVENGAETWACVEGCPVALMDAQSGVRQATLTGRADPTKSHSHPGTEFNSNSTFLGNRTHHSNVYADGGGASKYFAKFQQELEEPFIYCSKANRMKAALGEFKVEHDTLKPVELMRYLVRLVTPAGGLVLDSYCGSGTTCHAALLEGCSYIGIERNDVSYEEAVRRMEVVHRKTQEEGLAQDMLDFALGGVSE